MSINKENIIYCLKHPQLSGCLECPHYKELDGSLVECRRQRISEAISIIEDYHKIGEIMLDNLDDIHPLDRQPYRLSNIHAVLLEGGRRWGREMPREHGSD